MVWKNMTLTVWKWFHGGRLWCGAKGRVSVKEHFFCFYIFVFFAPLWKWDLDFHLNEPWNNCISTACSTHFCKGNTFCRFSFDHHRRKDFNKHYPAGHKTKRSRAASIQSWLHWLTPTSSVLKRIKTEFWLSTHFIHDMCHKIMSKMFAKIKVKKRVKHISFSFPPSYDWTSSIEQSNWNHFKLLRWSLKNQNPVAGCWAVYF